MHPYHEHRHHKVEKRRVHHILGRKVGGRVGSEEDSSYESDREIESNAAHRGDRGGGPGSSPSRRKAGGHVGNKRKKLRMDHRRSGGRAYAKGGRAHSDEAEDRALFKKMMKAEHKQHRAKGGRTKGKTNINIIIGQGKQQPAPMPMLPPPPPRPMGPPPGLPPGGPPGAAGALPPGGPPPGLPPGMPPPGLRKRGGRAVKNASNAVPPAPQMKPAGRTVIDAAKPLSGGASTPGDRMPPNAPGWVQGEKWKTPVQHTDGKIDGPDIGRGRPITYRKGGAVMNASNAVGPAKAIQGRAPPTSRAVPAAPGAPAKVSRAEPAVPMPKRYPLKAGSKSGVGRLEKAREGARGHNVP